MDALASTLEREIELLVRRLRGFSPSRWKVAAPPFETRAAAVFELAQVLGRLAAAPGPVPWVGEHALADQIAVLGRDLVGHGPHASVQVEALDAVRRTRELVGIR